MSDHVEGIVKKITEKATRNGGVMYNACIDTGAAEEWFGHGFDQPVFGEGDEIGFDIVYNGDYMNIDTASVEVYVAAAPKPARSAPAGRSGGGGGRGGAKPAGRSAPPARGGKPAARPAGRAAPAASDDKMSKDEWAQKDKMIQLQSAQNTAIALVAAACAIDAVALPTKKDARFDAFCALVDEEAERLHKQYREAVYGKPAAPARSSRRAAVADDEYDDDIPE